MKVVYAQGLRIGTALNDPVLGAKRSHLSRPTTPCPTCDRITRAAYVRAEREPGAKSTPFVAIGRTYCPHCDKLLPREK